MEWSKRGFSSVAHPGHRLHNVGFTRNQDAHASFDVGLAGTIFRYGWEAREMGAL